MKKIVLFIAIAFIASAGVKQANAQFTSSDVKYWIGTGSDTSLLIVDFHDASSWDTCYAWGFLHNGSATGEDMLNAVAASDVNFSVSLGGGFLSDITYGSHSGIGGTASFYWSTWSGTNIANLSMNSGVTTSLSNGSWFACSFTDFSPALATGEPIPALDPFSFTSQDVSFWIGSGTDTTILVLDFIDGSGASSFAWGYLHNASAIGENMLSDIAAADPKLTVSISGGFLNDITYDSYSGIGGNPNYWSTWSATNLGNWDMNMGISSTLGNGDLFACTYTDFAPAIRPDYPTAAISSVGIENYNQEIQFSVYPNPATDFITVNLSNTNNSYSYINIIDASGKTVYSETIASDILQIPVQNLPNGLYNIIASGEKTNYSKHFIKQ